MEYDGWLGEIDSHPLGVMGVLEDQAVDQGDGQLGEMDERKGGRDGVMCARERQREHSVHVDTHAMLKA